MSESKQVKYFQPMREDVLLLVDEVREESKLLWSPKADPETGTVVAVGPDTYDVYVGQRVWFHAGDPGIVFDHIQDRLRLVHQSTLQGEVIDEG